MPGPYRATVEPRYSDIDQQGHVNNVVYLDYLQQARVELLYDVWHAAMKEAGQVVVRAEIDYRRPIKPGIEPIVVEVWVSRIGGSSYTLGYRVIDEHGTVAAEASTVMATIDLATEKATRIPEDLRAVLEDLRLPE